MKKMMIICLLLIGLVLGVTSAPAVQAQGGCPPQMPLSHDYNVEEAIELTPPTPEQPAVAVPHNFVEVEVNISHDPRERVFLSSSEAALAPTCVDDYLEISGPLGVMTFDYRSGDRSRIEYRDPLATEITALLKPGPNTLWIRLVDVGQFYSNSFLYVVKVTGLPPLAPASTEQALPTATGTAKPTVTPTATSQAAAPALPRATATPKPTATQTVIVINDTPGPNGLVGVDWLPPDRLILGLVALVIAGVLAWFMGRRTNQESQVDELEFVDEQGNSIGRWDLYEYGREVSIGFGDQADIVLPIPENTSPVDTLPDIAAIIRREKVEGGVRQAVIEKLINSEYLELAERCFPLYDGSEVALGPYTVRYSCLVMTDREGGDLTEAYVL